MNGEPVLIQDSAFPAFLALVAVHVRAPGKWEMRRELGFEGMEWVTTRIRNAFRPLLPRGFQLIEFDQRHRYRLNSVVIVERVDRGVLLEHPLFKVQKAAAKLPAVG